MKAEQKLRWQMWDRLEQTGKGPIPMTRHDVALDYVVTLQRVQRNLYN